MRLPYSFYLAARAKTEESLREVREVEALDPLSIHPKCSEERLLYYARRFDEAITTYRKALEFEPADTGKCLWIGLAYLQKGMFNEAINELRRADTPNPLSTLPPSALGIAYYLSGRKADALRIRDRLVALANKRFLSPYDLAVFYTGIGRKNMPLPAWKKPWKSGPGCRSI